MNYLAHLYLASNEPLSLVGNLMGDFVKGNQFSEYPNEIIFGIQQHRAIDKFTDQHQEVINLKQWLSPQRKRFSGIISDIVFDHFLAKHWSQYSQHTLETFSQSVYQKLKPSLATMPPLMQTMVTRMISQDWLCHYVALSSTGQAIDGVSRRIRFPNQLSGAIEEVELHYDEYERVFNHFFPQLILFNDTLVKNPD